ncbi:ABC transporter substrate-binding protein [Streptomyces sp. A3M-1-3]|uniref:ABC transporter substrate-binding protein n=1 Tax=Streptomyces sp. A3M-1-3 TaxID=2962044 RepID=UPI0020B8F95B|nr:ABC transporter substrate-binding protein [Streptomyces sp. A3M-1-3]MCP3818175.1 ABC transporter substrate-binding protein [Streptomyces sp. A3M-1-3]
MSAATPTSPAPAPAAPDPFPHRRRTTRRAAALLLGCALALTGSLTAQSPAFADSSATSGKSAGQGKDTFTAGILKDPDSLNPFTGITAESYEMWHVSYDLLMGWSEKDFSPVPGLATSWEEAGDGKSWTYKIREGVKWSDGKPLTARDAAYTFNRILGGDYEQSNYGNYTANITKAEAPDDTTLVLHVKRSTPIMKQLWVPILPEHIWSEIDAKEVKSFSNEPKDGPVVSSGPFKLVDRKKGQFISFEANKDYWAGAPKIDRLVFKVYDNADAMALALKRGEIDYAYDLESSVFSSLEDAKGVSTRSATSINFDQIAFNNGAALADGTPIGDGHPALRDKRVRKALSLAIDRETLVERVLGGHGSPGDTVIPPIYEELHYAPGADAQKFDLEAAGRLLDEAGWKMGADGVRAKGGKKLELRLLTRQESKQSKDTGEFAKSWYARIGVPVTIKVVSEDTLVETVGQGNFDMMEWGWGVEPDPDYMLSVFTCDKRSYKEDGTVYAELSDSFYCNPEYDRLYQLQATQTDTAERAATVKQMQKLLYDDAAYAVTYYYDDLSAYRSDRWTGFTPQPAPDGPYLFQMGSYSYRSLRPVPAQAAASSGDSPTVLYLGGGLAALLLLGVGGTVIARRRGAKSADERE